MSDNINRIPYFIYATDYLIEQSPEFIAYNPFEKMISFIINMDMVEISNEERVLANMNNFNSVIGYAKEKGYIRRPKDNHSTSMYELTDLGREVKAAGGINNFLSIRNNLQNAVFENLKINKRIADATEKAAKATEEGTSYNKTTRNWIIAYTVITFLILIVSIATCYYANNDQTKATITNNSKTEITANKDTDTIK